MSFSWYSQKAREEVVLEILKLQKSRSMFETHFTPEPHPIDPGFASLLYM